MSDDSVGLKVAEYQSLRNEMLLNKQHIFERPLLIIGAAAVAASQLNNPDLILFLPAVLIAFLWLNVFFTIDRIRSTARIVAYISLFHETSELNWEGWENALRKYRIWQSKNKKGVESISHALKTQNEQPKAMVFYPSIYYIHVIPGALSLLAILAVLYSKQNAVEISAATLTTILFVAFFYGTWKYNPRKMTALLEEQRKVWLTVFGKLPFPPDSTTLIEEAAKQNRGNSPALNPAGRPETVP